RRRRLQRPPALANDDDPPTLLATLEQLLKVNQRIVINVVPLKINSRPATAHRRRDLVVVLSTARLEQRPRSHVRTANPQHDRAPHRPRHAMRRRLYI